jgi:hypothetical protein
MEDIKPMNGVELPECLGPGAYVLQAEGDKLLVRRNDSKEQKQIDMRLATARAIDDNGCGNIRVAKIAEPHDAARTQDRALYVAVTYDLHQMFGDEWSSAVPVDCPDQRTVLVFNNNLGRCLAEPSLFDEVAAEGGETLEYMVEQE